MPWCTYCGQAFTRDEHLERHILTHTNVKPYKCPSCFMSFARRDLLQRHYLVHGRNPDQNPDGSTNYSGILPRSAGRTPIACHNCAKTKTKCDKKFPCSRCASRNLTCTARPTRRTTKSMRATEQMIPAESTASPPSKTVPTPPPSGSSSNGCPSPTSPERHVATISVKSVVHSSSPSEERDDGVFNAAQIDMAAGQHEAVSPTEFLPEPSFLPEDISQLASGNFMHSTDSISANVSESQFLDLSHTMDWSQMNPSMDCMEPVQYGDYQGQESIFSWPENLDPGSFVQLPYENHQDGFFGQRPSPQTTNSCNMSLIRPNPDTNGAPIRHFRQSLSESLDYFPTAVQQTGAHHELYLGSGNEASTDGIQSLSTSPKEYRAAFANHDHWPLLQSMPMTSSQATPKTAQFNLDRLRRGLQNLDVWENICSLTWPSKPDFPDSPLIVINVEPLQELACDKLGTYMQSSLLRAMSVNGECTMCTYENGLATPRSDLSTQTGNHYRSSSMPTLSVPSTQLMLPPSHVVNGLLIAYAGNFERFFPVTAQGILSADNLILNPRTGIDSACLLALLMITEGAKTSASIDARWLVHGLTEVCRFGLSELIEKDLILANDLEVLHSALLVTYIAAWSGDKCQMDIAMNQEKAWLTRLRESGFIEGYHQSIIPSLRSKGTGPSTESLWKDWTERENYNRIVYSWAMLDQDLSLFHDVSPLLSVREFGASLPHPDHLWHAKTAREWATLCEKRRKSPGASSSGDPWPASLRELFSQFLGDNLKSCGAELSPMQLRLLLHPLQALVFQHRQLLSCFSPSPNRNRAGIGSRSMTDTTHRHFDELRTLLRRWYSLADIRLRIAPICPMMQSALVIFHLISLNAIASLPEIEGLARRELSLSTGNAGVDFFPSMDSGSAWTRQSLLGLHAQCLTDVEGALFHAGQILRLVRGMSPRVRPAWWAGAVYRAALVLWCDARAHSSNDTFAGSLDPSLFMATSGPMSGDVNMDIDFDGMYGSGSAGIGASHSGMHANLRQCDSSTASGTQHAGFFAIDSLSPDHPLIVKYLTRREGVPMLTRCDGSQIRIDNVDAVLCHCIDILNENGTGNAFVEGIAGKLAKLAKVSVTS